jgi:outer membrane receptor for ferrienterochelin and colicins
VPRPDRMRMRIAIGRGVVLSLALVSAAAADPLPAPTPSEQAPLSPAPAPKTDDHGAAWSPTAAWRPTPALRQELGLAEMLNMSATVATKSSASVSSSPGVVTVYGEQDIRRLGYYTLADLADVTAGYSSRIAFGEKVLESRGQKAGSFVNNKHLVLIDGIPVNHGRGNKAMIDENFPLFFADRVEMLKGPASALYGTGAFFGVINIAPKELDESGFLAEARAGLGTAQADKRVAANALYRDAVRHAALYAGFFDKGPSAAYVGGATNLDNRFWDNQRSEFLYLTYGVDSGAFTGLKGGMIYSSKNGGLGEHWVPGHSPMYDDLTWVQMIPYLKYERRLARTVAVDGYFKASRDSEKATAAASGDPAPAMPGNLVLIYSSSVAVYEGLAELRWEPVTDSWRWNVIGGVNVNISYQNSGSGDYGGFVSSVPGKPTFQVNPRTLTSDDIFQTYSTFVQTAATLPVLTALHLTAGARLDAGTGTDTHFWRISPRVGVVQELTSTLSLKLLFDTALRAPGIKEVGLNHEVLDQLLNPLDAGPVFPETIQSLEGGLAWVSRHVSAQAAVFVNETRDALDGRAVKGKDNIDHNVFTNTREVTMARGGEVEVTVAASADARLFANYSYARAALRAEQPISDTARANLADVPLHKLNAGASYRWLRPLDLTTGLVAKYVSGYRGAATAANPSPPEPAGHLLFDANLIARLTEHLGVELLARNLADRVYQLPERGVPYIPMPRRSFHLTLDYRW